MDALATDEERAIRRTAREFFANATPARDSWSDAAELGWLGLSVPEEHGGLGLGLREEVIIFEEAGAALFDAPLLSTLGLALPVFLAAGDGARVADIAAGALAATLGWAEDGGPSALGDAAQGGTAAEPGPSEYRLTGWKRWVPDAERGPIAARSRAHGCARSPARRSRHDTAARRCRAAGEPGAPSGRRTGNH